LGSPGVENRWFLPQGRQQGIRLGLAAVDGIICDNSGRNKVERSRSNTGGDWHSTFLDRLSTQDKSADGARQRSLLGTPRPANGGETNGSFSPA
jgi:hypothetical protein